MPAKKKTTKTRAKAVAKRTTKSALALPDDLRQEFEGHISRDRATVVAATGWPVVRTSAGGFSLGGQPLPAPFETIVLGGIRQNVLFEGAYDATNPSLPTCAAVDIEGNEATMAPPPKIGKSDLCLTCEYNAWGSGTGRGKACKNQLKTAIFPYDPSIDYTRGGRGAVLNLPPTALKAWAEYASHVVDDLCRPLFTVITRFEIQILQQGFTVVPSFGGVISDAATLRALAVRAEEDARKTLELLPPIDEDPAAAAAPAQTGGVRRRKVERKRRK